MRGIPVMYLSGESPDEEDNAFVRWAHRVRRLSSMTALRASADRADVLLERKLRFEYAKLKARGQLRANFRRRYAAAVPITAGSHRTSVVTPPASTVTGEKRPGSQVDPDHGVQKLSTAYKQSCRRGTSYSHEFSDSGYPRHFTRYWY